MEKEILLQELHYIRNSYRRAAGHGLRRKWQVSGQPVPAAELQLQVANDANTPAQM